MNASTNNPPIVNFNTNYFNNLSVYDKAKILDKIISNIDANKSEISA